MKNFRSTRLLLSFVFLAVIFSFSNSKAEEYKLSFTFGEVVTSLNAEDFINHKEKYNSSKFTYEGKERYYLIIQFNEIPTQEVIVEIKTSGIELLEYLPYNAYIAGIPSDLSIEDINKFGIRSIMELPFEYKISKNLLGEVPEWARVQGNKYRALIHYFRDIAPDIVFEELKKAGAENVIYREGQHSFIIEADIELIRSIVSKSWLMHIEPAFKPKGKFNLHGKTDHRSKFIQYPSSINGYGLTGNGVKLGIWDGGGIGNHIDFTNRLTRVETATYDEHATHCLGTAAGAGINQSKAQGMAPNALLYAWDFEGDIVAEMGNGLANQGIMLSTNSYGNTQQSPCGSRGFYDTEARGVDILSRDSLFFSQIFAAGNEANDCTNGWGTVGDGINSAKNIITVAAVDSADVVAWFSSRGPVLDGRIKPEISGIGVDVYSTQDNHTYEGTDWSGTSMATPGIAGTIAQIYEKYRLMNNNNKPASAMIKALVCNTADDIGNSGPDYIYGFGRINARRAVKALVDNNIISGSISQGQSLNHTINIPQGTTKLKVTVCWTDREASINANPALVNNLNIQVTPFGGTAYNPWILNQTSPANAATRGVDNRNPIEQVTIDYPNAGSCTISISGATVPYGPQQYYIVYEFIGTNITVVYPNGSELLSVNQPETIRWDSEGLTQSFTVQYSNNGGVSWTNLASNIPVNIRHYNWSLTGLPFTANGKIRVVSGTVSDQSDSTFHIAFPVPNLVANGQASQIDLGWGSLADATAYEVNKLINYQWVPIDTVTNTTYADTGLANGFTYWYSVRAFFGAEVRSNYSTAAYSQVGAYCEVSADCDEYISNVTINTINNSSDCTEGGYANYSDISTSLNRGQSYPITITNGNPYTQDRCGLWVDWNQDGDFSDQYETITLTGTPGNGPYTGTVTVPQNASFGYTRLRARIVYNTTALACGSSDYGETEDYTLIITSSIAAPNLVSPANNAVNQAVPLTFSWSSVTGATGYILQGAGDAQFSSMSFSVSGITGTSHTIDGMLPNTTYYWRVAAMTATSTGPWSSAWSFTTAGGTPPIGMLNGTIAYANSALTPMNNCIIVVSDTNEVEIGRDTTDAAGNFSIPGAGTGIFFIEIFTNKAHGGVTIADVLLMRQSIAGLITLNSLETKAADININGTVNIQDVLPMRQKIANITPISSWLVPDYIYEITNINTAGTTTTLTIEALCGGDVNGSYTPPNN